MTAETWTPEAHARLVELAALGKSPREMAAELGVTRNAVIGRCFRTGVKLKGIKRSPRPLASRKKRGGRDDAFRIAAVCGTLTGESIAKCAARLKVSPGALNAWRRNPEIMAQATAMAERLKARWAEAEAGKARLAALFAADERARVDRCNAPILARMSPRHRTMMERRVAGETLASIGASFGLSRQRIRQIEIRWRTEGLEVPQARPLNAEAAERMAWLAATTSNVEFAIRTGPLDDGLTPYWREKVERALREFPPSHKGRLTPPPP